MIEKGTTWIKHTGRFALDGYFRLEEQGTAFTGLTPIANNLHLYAKDKAGVTELFYKNSSGTERDLSGGLTGSGTANRLAYWSAAQVLDDVAALTQHRLLVADVNGLPTNSNLLAAGSVLFGDANGIPEDDNANLFWDNSNKRFGIGTAAPASTFHMISVGAAGAAFKLRFDHYSGGATTPDASYLGQGSRGTVGTPTAVQSGDILGGVNLGGHDGTAFSGAVTYVRGFAGENWSTTAHGSYVAIATTPNTTLTLTERMRLLNDGCLLIGATAHVFGAPKLNTVQNATNNVAFQGSAYADAVRFRATRANGSLGSETDLLALESMGAYTFAGWANSAYNAQAGILADASENWSSTNRGSQFRFTVTANATTAQFVHTTMLNDGGLQITRASGYLDLSLITAGSPNVKVTATSDTPTVAFTGGGNAPTTAPAGYLEILVGANARYIPFWA